LPVLYWETLWTSCFLHFWQKVLLCFGVCTYNTVLMIECYHLSRLN
jgi:hypothetical protein